MLPYVVQPGDTLLRIAKRFDVNAVSLLAVNPRLRADSYLAPGQLLAVPDRPVRVYSIQAGDTLMQIAERFNCSVQALIALNPKLDPKLLMSGQLLSIPESHFTRIVDPRAEYGHAELAADILALEQAYPFWRTQTIGSSVLGKPITAFKLGEGPRKLHVNAAMHANEWITTPLLMTFAEDIAVAYASGDKLGGYNIRALLKQMSVWFVPLVNPDGVELVQEGLRPGHPMYNELLDWNCGSERFVRWKSNARGIDLNDQFPAFWEEEVVRRAAVGPCRRDFPGDQPLSEPEAQALADFTREEQFDMVVALHTQGQEIYWNYRGYEPPEAESIAHRLGRAGGYKPVKLKGSDAGYKDWFIYEFRRPGFTVEVGYGVNPLPLSDFQDLYDELRPLLLSAMEATIQK